MRKSHTITDAMIIRAKALQLGAKPEDWRRWKFRGRISPKWRELIFLASTGAISFKDMDEVFKKDIRDEQ